MSTQRPQSQSRIKGRRTVRRVVMLTPAEDDKLKTKASEQNVTVPKLLADSALQKDVSRRAVMLELTGLRRQLADNPEALEWLRNHYGHLESR